MLLAQKRPSANAAVTVVHTGVADWPRCLLPDVDEACARVVSAITPRVGGVGPTTVAMLFRNAITAAERTTT
jgi:methylenetetrahydrofolate dehydrogenase (NADP+)/methenyltetrahydrofolate cyclohydrolase